MKIVIDISEEDYIFVKKQVADGITNPLKICIANGTPLEEELEKFKEELGEYSRYTAGNDLVVWWEDIEEVFNEHIEELKGENKQSRCNNCQNNTDELSGECYECVKGIEDWYEPLSEWYRKSKQLNCPKGEQEC